MAYCIECSTTLGNDVELCPICGSYQEICGNGSIDNIDKKLNTSTTVLFNKISDGQVLNNEQEIERLIKRGEECFNSGKLWLGAKERRRARKEFQRAFNYYETVLKLDPKHELAKEARARCLGKMA